MGKAQSKRSVDITTEPKKGDEEVTGKLEKIEDVDQKQVVNGDATPQETNEAEKKETEESENDKDMTTEKNAETAQAGGDNADQSNTATAAESPKEETVAKEGAAASAEEISPLADESSKKSKKEKVKKKWSFRSISFGKKDKQKPSKAEETAAADAATTNGEAAPADSPTAAEGVNEAAGGEGEQAAKQSTEKMENGDASEKEMNGQKTPTPTDEKPAAEVVATPTATEAAATPVADSSNDTTATNQTENKAAAATVAVETVEAAASAMSNGAAEKNGLDAVASSPTPTDGGEKTLMKETVTDADAAAIVEKIKTIPSVMNDDDNTPHQNGTNGSGVDADAEVKSQNEEIATAKDLKENAAAEITTQDLPVTCE